MARWTNITMLGELHGNVLHSNCGNWLIANYYNWSSNVKGYYLLSPYKILNGEQYWNIVDILT